MSERLTRVQSKAAEDPRESEEETEQGAGTAMALDEGKMGKEDASRSAGQYAMKNQSGEPGLGRAAVADEARNAGILGVLGSADPAAGLSSGVSGQGPGGGGTGYGTIGTGRYGTIGHGSGTGAGYGVGSGGVAMYGRAGNSARGQAGGAWAYQQGAPLPDARNTESYIDYGQNKMTETAEDRLSTFAVDVDTASYAIARRKIRDGVMPPPSSVRVEEFVNYFGYDYAGPTDGRPFAVHMDAAPSPFTTGRHILRVGVQAKRLANNERKAANLVFLVDVSGSMRSPDKLELAKRALRILVDNLQDGDTVALVTYAGRVSVVLEPTGLEHKGEIMSSIDDLSAGGSTAMGSGIELAYGLAAKNLRPGAISRVIVLSDGDANVGRTSHEQILATIAGHVKEGVTLSTVGFGMGNYKDSLMEQLANKGNGNYYYIDGISQARRVFQEQLGGTLEVVAKDVKIQVDFDPEVVTRYRLIGYENRDIADRDFRNDRVDAGEIGAGHTVTALYEMELRTELAAPPAVVRIRAKKPRGEKASEAAYGFDMGRLYGTFAAAPADLRFATAVMGAAEILRKSKHAADWRLGDVIEIAQKASRPDQGERQEFLELMRSVAPRMARAQGGRAASQLASRE